MKKRSIVLSLVVVCLAATVLFPPRHSSAEPILKPRKYHGPIPQRYFTFTLGLFGGADNSDMWDRIEFLEIESKGPFQKYTETNDFGSSLAFGASFAKKVHPQFTVRTQLGLSILGSDSKGFIKGDPDTLLLHFKRDFDVLLFSLDATGLFFFQDASVKEFQSYIGGGFSLYFPYATYTEDLTYADVVFDEENRIVKPVDKGIPYASTSKSDWSMEPGVHGIIGFLYHFKPTVAFNMEGRVQIAQSRFTIDQRTSGGIRPVKFTIDYTGFILNVGIAKFF